MRPLPREAREVLAHLELLMHGGTASWNSNGHSAERPLLPVGESQPPHLVYRRLMEERPERIPTLIRDAWTVYERATGRYQRPEPVGELPHLRNQRMIRDGEGFTIAEVARAFDVTTKVVIEIRKAARNPERDIALGRPLSPEMDDRTRVMTLHARGVPAREIARQTGKSHPTVLKWTREAAA